MTSRKTDAGERRLNAWGNFRKEIARIHEQYEIHKTFSGMHIKNQILFRGQSNADWRLKTTLDRTTSVPLTFIQYLRRATSCAPEIESCTGKNWSIPNWPTIEQEMLSSKEFFFPEITVPCYDYLVYLRQNGFPSPLLDWTSSPFIASYFAYCDNPGCDRVAVFAYIDGIKAGSDVGPWITVMGPKVRTHSRHFSQKAWYTIAAKPHDSGYDFDFCQHEDVVAAGDGKQDVLIKITMPMADRKAALRELEDQKINAFTLFQTEEALVRTMGLRQFDLK